MSTPPLAALLPALALVLPLLAACGGRSSPPPPAWRGAGAEVEVTVQTMHCAGCEAEVERTLGAIEGVREVVADHQTGLVRIHLSDAGLRETAIPRIRDAIHADKRIVVGEDPAPESP